MYRIHQIKLSLDEPIDKIPDKILKKIGIRDLSIKEWRIVKESIDARDKKNIKKIYSVDFEGSRKLQLEEAPAEEYHLPQVCPKAVASAESGDRPVIIGFGPAGIFSALILAQTGLRPIVLERGKDADSRTADVESFWSGGPLNTESNVQFGEGGAGAFSDGKLTTGIKDIRIEKVIGELVRFGAPPEISYKQKPHIGTDLLRLVVKNLRQEIIALGGEIRFETRAEDIITEEQAGGSGRRSRIRGVVCRERDGRLYEIPCGKLILAIGHSARDTFAMLCEKGAAMEQKPFSIGVRIEHPQELIDKAQYGCPSRIIGLPPAEYKLSYRCKDGGGVTGGIDGRGVYTFCMCPGGQVINASSAEGGVVVNGMSMHARNSGRANSALLCDVRTSDFGSDDVLAGVRFQEKYEHLACRASGGQRPPETTWGALRDGKAPLVEGCLPEFAVAAFRQAMPELGKKLKGFADDNAKIYAVETRSSSPVRILRDKDGQSLSIAGLYPCGEGAGYAGGITSAAVDGIKMAEAVIRDMN